MTGSFGLLNALLLTVLATVLPATAAGEPAAVASERPNRIVNLYDAFGYAAKGTTLDWGFSALVEFQGRTILFGGGSDVDILRHNAGALGVDLGRTDFAVLSHRHGDHANGFDYLLEKSPRVKLYLPDDRALGAPEAWKFPAPPPDLASLPSEQLTGGERARPCSIARAAASREGTPSSSPPAARWRLVFF